MTRRANAPFTGNKRLQIALPPEVWDALTERAGPAVPGKPSGPIEHVRRLLYADLGLELPDPEERHRLASARLDTKFTGAREKRGQGPKRRDEEEY